MQEKDIDLTEYFECDCGTPEHLMVAKYYKEARDLETQHECYKPMEYVSLSLQLSHFIPWYRRILPAIAYVFGQEYHNCGWGDTLFEEPEKLQRLKDFLENKLTKENKNETQGQ